jgi:hypothetical protein
VRLRSGDVFCPVRRRIYWRGFQCQTR